MVRQDVQQYFINSLVIQETSSSDASILKIQNHHGIRYRRRGTQCLVISILELRTTVFIFSTLLYYFLQSLFLASEMLGRSASRGEAVCESTSITEILFLGSRILLFPSVRVLLSWLVIRGADSDGTVTHCSLTIFLFHEPCVSLIEGWIAPFLYSDYSCNSYGLLPQILWGDER